jgi:simple sugar transport system ATP-binding protein
MADDLIRMENINKFYGRIHALRGVSLTVKTHEVVGLLGDNGAGKSTLIKVLSGAVPLTSGDIIIKGRKVELKSTADAIAHGIETIFQDSASSLSCRSHGISSSGASQSREAVS